ncbi:hypothetical protein LR48_Vigan02g185100 [Vigna angularis]|uniref:Uncharacterized protein n=1 Tax=Phaseolus angularis TaxID=3914 RepID=A0A0L9TYX1_PHAAN|nr:hypothetical protein LR48_Vigan02g185100 [Vigna angularis]
MLIVYGLAMANPVAIRLVVVWDHCPFNSKMPKVPPGGSAQVSQGGSARAVVPKFHKATTSARPAIAR